MCLPPPTRAIRRSCRRGLRPDQGRRLRPQSAVRAAREGCKVTSATLLDTMLDPAVRSARRRPRPTRLATTPSRCSPRPKRSSRRPRRARGQGPAAHRRPGLGEGAGRSQPVRVGDGERQGGHLPHLLHQCRPRAQGGAGLQIVQIPPELAVGAEYGMIVLKDAPVAAASCSPVHILSEEGRRSWSAWLRARRRAG